MPTFLSVVELRPAIAEDRAALKRFVCADEHAEWEREVEHWFRYQALDWALREENVESAKLFLAFAESGLVGAISSSREIYRKTVRARDPEQGFVTVEFDGLSLDALAVDSELRGARVMPSGASLAELLIAAAVARETEKSPPGEVVGGHIHPNNARSLAFLDRLRFSPARPSNRNPNYLLRTVSRESLLLVLRERGCLT